MQGQVCVVTGATSGIGKAAAAALARQGAEIIVVGRDPGRAEATAAAIQAGGAPPPKVEIADLARLDQVRALAGRLNQTLDRIDVLINNAGLVLNERQVTPDGYEHVFAVNHLAPFLLTNLLRPKLTASAPARVITVSSDAHTAARLDLDDPNLEHGWSSWRSYSNSKLANILFTRELARRLDGTGVTANCLHPGVVRTGFGRDARPLMRAASRSPGRSCCPRSAARTRSCTWPAHRTWPRKPAGTTSSASSASRPRRPATTAWPAGSGRSASA